MIHAHSRSVRFIAFIGLVLLFVGLVHAQADGSQDGSAPADTDTFILQPGDFLRVSFPGAPDLDTELRIRRDGVLTLPLVGEVMAANKQPRELEAELVELYGPQLVVKEVVVTVLNSEFTFYVEGEVNGPGKYVSFRPVSVLEAIITAGGIDKTNGNPKSIRVIRRVGDRYQFFRLDLNAVLEGKSDEAFLLQPYDIVSVPRRFW